MAKKTHPQWAYFGQEMRRLRRQAGMSQTQLGAKMQVTGSMVGHLEQATRIPKRDQVDALESVFTTGGNLLRQWSEVIDDHKVPNWFKDVLLMERRAQEIREYQPLLIPGLLQTHDYARVLVGSWQPRAAPEAVEETVRTRLERLPGILAHRPLLWFVVDDVVLRRPMGEPRVLVEQLAHIVSLVEDGRIRFQILPSTPVHPGVSPPFRVMMLSERQTVVYVDHALGGETRSEPREVAQMATLFGAMQAESLSPGESLDYIRTLGKEITT